MPDADSSLIVKNNVEILLAGETSQQYAQELSRLEETFGQEGFGIRTETVSADAFTEEQLPFKKEQSIRFILFADTKTAKRAVADVETEKAVLESGAQIICAEETENLYGLLEEQIRAQARDAQTGMLSGMDVDYTGEYEELAADSRYAVRFLVEFKNAATGKTTTSTYAEKFIPKKPGTYSIYLQTAPKNKEGRIIGRYEGSTPVITGLRVYVRPEGKTETTLSAETSDLAKVKASVTECPLSPHQWWGERSKQ